MFAKDIKFSKPKFIRSTTPFISELETNKKNVTTTLLGLHIIKDLRFITLWLFVEQAAIFFCCSVFSKLHYITLDRAGESLAFWIECVRLCVAIWWAKKNILKNGIYTIIFRVIRIHLVFFCVVFFFSFVFSL